MPTEPIPAELKDFLARHIDSIAQLEALLLSRGSAGAVWDAPATSKRLYIGEQEAAATLAHLAEQGLLMRAAAGYKFSPQSAELAGVVDLLAHHYARHLIPITNLIHAKPRRIRQFSDAFKLKKD
jgi:hypothetical protein